MNGRSWPNNFLTSTDPWRRLTRFPRRTSKSCLVHPILHDIHCAPWHKSGTVNPKILPRIALLFEYASLNGGERSMLACVDWLQRHDTNLDFVAIAPAQGRLADALNGRNIDLIPWNSRGDDGASREHIEHTLIDAVRQARPALLHANSLSMGRLTGRIAAMLPIPTSCHLRDILNLSGAAMADLNCNQRLIAVSQATSDFHVSRGMDPARVVVVQNGLDLVQFQPRAASGSLHRELHLPANAILVATIGQIGLRKGQEILAAAATDIVHEVPVVHFLLIGERSSTKAESVQFEQSIKQRFAEQNLQSRLHCLGYRDDVPDLLAEIDLIVHPAHQEPFGRVLLEAAACGVAVVATNVGGTPEIVVDGVTGRLVPPRDPQALAAAVAGLLTNEDQRRAMGAAARRHAVNVFDVARSAERLLQCWRTLI